MYCVYCGVKLQDGAGECPLCHTPVVLPEQPGTGEKTLYSDRMPAEEKSARPLVVWIITTVMIAAGLGCLIFCLRTMHEAAWSGYVLRSMGLVWVTLLFPLLFCRYRPKFAPSAIEMIWYMVQYFGSFSPRNFGMSHMPLNSMSTRSGR